MAALVTLSLFLVVLGVMAAVGWVFDSRDGRDWYDERHLRGPLS
jgi:hypothetical protein